MFEIVDEEGRRRSHEVAVDLEEFENGIACLACS